MVKTGYPKLVKELKKARYFLFAERVGRFGVPSEAAEILGGDDAEALDNKV